MSEKIEEQNTNEVEAEASKFDKVKQAGHKVWVKAKPVVKAVGVGIIAGAAILGIGGFAMSRMTMDELAEPEENEEPEAEDIPFEESSETESSEEQEL